MSPGPQAVSARKPRCASFGIYLSPAENGFVFNDLLTDYERISDHCSNIAVNILDSAGTWVEAHNYVDNIAFRQESHFTELFQEYSRKYSLQ